MPLGTGGPCEFCGAGEGLVGADGIGPPVAVKKARSVMLKRLRHISCRQEMSWNSNASFQCMIAEIIDKMERSIVSTV